MSSNKITRDHHLLSRSLKTTSSEIKMNDGTNDIFSFNVAEPALKIMDDVDQTDYFQISTGAAGATTLSTVDTTVGATGHLTLDVDGNCIINAGGTITLNGKDTMGSTYFQDDGDTYAWFSAHHSGSHFILYENEGASSVDYLHITTMAKGETDIETIDDQGAEAHLNFSADGHINLNYNAADGAVRHCATGFTQITASFDATDTDINFKNGNKQILTLTADITDVHFQFPAVSGNFLCVFLQDGTGGWDVTNWKTKDAAGNAGNGNSGIVKWAGGSATSLTETANKADIISIYWDATNEMAYAVASENF